VHKPVVLGNLGTWSDSDRVYRAPLVL